MNNLQKTGGVAALIDAATFIVGIALALSVLTPYAMGDLDPGETVAFLADNQTVMYIWNLTIFMVFGLFLVILTIALYERLKAGSRSMAQTATAFGLIWATLMFASAMIFNIGSASVIDLHGTDAAQATTVWLAIDAVLGGLGGGNEIVGGLWILFVSWAALRGGGLPRALNYFGVVVALAGLLTIVPALDLLGFLFGLGSIVWFLWVGIAMLRGGRSPAE